MSDDPNANLSKIQSITLVLLARLLTNRDDTNNHMTAEFFDKKKWCPETPLLRQHEENKNFLPLSLVTVAVSWYHSRCHGYGRKMARRCYMTRTRSETQFHGSQMSRGSCSDTALHPEDGRSEN